MHHLASSVIDHSTLLNLKYRNLFAAACLLLFNSHDVLFGVRPGWFRWCWFWKLGRFQNFSSFNRKLPLILFDPEFPLCSSLPRIWSHGLPFLGRHSTGVAHTRLSEFCFTVSGSFLDRLRTFGCAASFLDQSSGSRPYGKEHTIGVKPERLKRCPYFITLTILFLLPTTVSWLPNVFHGRIRSAYMALKGLLWAAKVHHPGSHTRDILLCVLPRKSGLSLPK